MDEEAKKVVAMFRFGVIHDFIAPKTLSRGDKKRLLREKTVLQWDIPYSGKSYISPSTILNWIRKYEDGGRRIEALYPDDRQDKGMLRAIDEDSALCLVNLKRQLKEASLPVIVKEAERKGMLQPDFKASKATIYRLFERHGLNDKDREPEDRRRFEAELPNDIWQSDCMHGVKVDVDGKGRKSYLFAFIDDHSRLIPHAEFYLHERLDSYIDCLMKALGRRGLPRKLYVDNGPTFRSHQLSFACASLGIALIHSKPYQPEGRGKIERWFKTVRMQFLCTISDGLTLQELNERLHEWIEKQYHMAVHSSTKETPLKRYLKELHLIREAPKDLRDYFRKRATRKVDRDRTVSILGRLYEAPVELIGKSVTLLYHETEPMRIEVFYNNKSYGMLEPLNLNINCRIRRRQGITEVLPKKEDELKGMTLQPQPQYSGGKLFEKQEDKDEL